MSNIEHKVAQPVPQQAQYSCALALKSLSDEGVFAGYASVFNVVDSQHDMILPGAFASTLYGRKREIKLLWQHDMREPIGVIEEVREDVNGLYVKGRLLMEIARAREAYSLLKKGVVSGLSIGYSPLRYRLDADSGVRVLQSVDLWEISLVTFPANQAARVTVVKQATPREPHASEHKLWQQAVSSGEAMRFAAALERATTALRNIYA